MQLRLQIKYTQLLSVNKFYYQLQLYNLHYTRSEQFGVVPETVATFNIDVTPFPVALANVQEIASHDFVAEFNAKFELHTDTAHCEMLDPTLVPVGA
jgi:hypothetical protein